MSKKPHGHRGKRTMRKVPVDVPSRVAKRLPEGMFNRAFFGGLDLKHPDGRLGWVFLDEDPAGAVATADRDLRADGRMAILAVMHPEPMAMVPEGACIAGQAVQADPFCPRGRVYVFHVPADSNPLESVPMR